MTSPHVPIGCPECPTNPTMAVTEEQAALIYECPRCTRRFRFPFRQHP